MAAVLEKIGITIAETGLTTETCKNGNGQSLDITSSVVLVKSIDPKIAFLREMLENPTYLRPFQHVDMYLSPSQWTQHHLKTRAREAIYTLTFIAAGAASIKGGKNIPEEVIEQYKKFRNHEQLDEGYNVWKNQFGIVDKYLD